MTSTVYIAKTVYGGDGLGRLGDGRVVFVPGAFAGENVKAEIVEEKKHFVKARLVEIVEASPDRIGTGPQPIPGMVYSNLAYAAEERTKAEQLADFFARARIPLKAPPALIARAEIANPLAPCYRNKVVYHFAKTKKGEWKIGYREEPSHEIVDIAFDPLARPEINAALPEVRKAVLTLLTQGPVGVRKETERKGNVTIRWSERTGVKWWVGDAPGGVVIKETTAGKVFEVPSDGFYQVNPVQGDALVRAVVADYLKNVDAAPDLLDLYCGVGVFGLCCRTAAGAKAGRLTGIESGRQAIDFAKRNAVQLGAADARFFAEEVGRNLRRISVGARTTVVVDPPRGGLEPRGPEWLAQSRAPRIFYVSCDPATLMRDLRVLVRGYEVESVRWIDMFPRTARFETLVALRRR